MSANSAIVINRSNETSPFYNALKSRNSKSLPELYSSEINTEAAAQSRVKISSSTTPGYSRTVRIPLVRYGMLNRLYLHSQFSKAGGTPAGDAAVEAVPFIGAFVGKEYRLMYQGQVICKTTPWEIIAYNWKYGTDRERNLLQEMLGAFNIDGTASGVPASADRASVHPSNRVIAGAGRITGIQDFYLPLDFFFSSKWSANRNLDLSVLANEVTLEIDVDSASNLWHVTKVADAQAPTLDTLEAVCYLTELNLEVEKTFRSLQYAAGAAPTTQLCFNTEHMIVASGIDHNSADTVIEVKLNQFSGSVQKFLVWAQLVDDFGTNKDRIRPCALNELQLKAVGTNIYNADKLQEKEELLEIYNQGGQFKSLGETEATSGWADIECNPQFIYCINLKKPLDMNPCSASGSISMGQLSTPSLRLNVAGVAGAPFGTMPNLQTGGAVKLEVHVVAYMTTLVSYQTNSSGSTNIRMINN